MNSFDERVRGLLGTCAMVSAIAVGSAAAPSVGAETSPQQMEQAPGLFSDGTR